MPSYNKHLPFLASIKERYPLTKEGSKKNTQHIVLGLEGSGLEYRVGDSIGVFPTNDPELVRLTIAAAQLSEDTVVSDSRRGDQPTLMEFLSKRANLSKITKKLLGRLAKENPALEDLIEDRSAQKDYIKSRFVVDALEDYPAKLEAQEFVDFLKPMTPRFYSIASSQKAVGSEVHFTIALVEYSTHGRLRHGVTTHFLCNHAPVNEACVPIYLQPTRDFLLPEDPNTPIIMIGPGTGIAPFLAFMQERIAQKASGKNWLFFGEWNQATDFFYEDYWRDLEEQGKLRLEAAFSRDQDHKVYVQHRMLEQSREIWDWLQNGAVIYVCGDASRMAKDVEAALIEIASSEGQMGEKEAKSYVKGLRKSKRYLRDVY